ncbi:MAG: hypothetical protein KF850_19975 [Labilithrix sp.]|nr:hypothetical protein [Labilithrix sp.]MBX3214323.1 hypothetical protein [Labilithrix sp.]
MSTLGESLVEIVVSELEQNPAFRERLKKALAVEPAPEPKPEFIYLPIVAWAKHVQIGRSKAFELAKDPTFPTVMSGRARRVDVRAAEQWMRERFAQANARRSA